MSNPGMKATQLRQENRPMRNSREMTPVIAEADLPLQSKKLLYPPLAASKEQLNLLRSAGTPGWTGEVGSRVLFIVDSPTSSRRM